MTSGLGSMLLVCSFIFLFKEIIYFDILSILLSNESSEDWKVDELHRLSDKSFPYFYFFFYVFYITKESSFSISSFITLICGSIYCNDIFLLLSLFGFITIFSSIVFFNSFFSTFLSFLFINELSNSNNYPWASSR